MFSSFKIELNGFSQKIIEEYYKKGVKIYDAHKLIIKKSLDKYLSVDGELKASDIEADWFPSIKAHVFLSHSHKDEKAAIALAGLLNEIGLTVFIDSCVWGYADDLLRQIDDKYCVLRRGADGSIDMYDYQRRNQSTAHVHMILNGALMKMMDNTECLAFLDTPNALKTKDISSGITNSGWIYSELLMSKVLQRKYPIRKSLRFAVNESVRHDGLSVQYDVDIKHLINVSVNDIYSAIENGNYGLNFLDYLYCAKGLCIHR